MTIQNLIDLFDGIDPSTGLNFSFDKDVIDLGSDGEVKVDAYVTIAKGNEYIADTATLTFKRNLEDKYGKLEPLGGDNE